MRRSVFLCAVSFFSLAAISKGVVTPPVLGQLRANELYAKPAAAESDIWVYGGAWCYWDGGGVVFGDDIDLAELGKRFLAESGYAANASPVTAIKPIPVDLAGYDIYILDSTALHFPKTGAAAGGIYGFGEVKLESGKLQTEVIYATSGVYIGADCELNVTGQISSGGVFECYGGIIRAGDIYARKIWLDSSCAPLYLTVTDSVLTGYFTQCGGSIEIGGGLFAVSEDSGDGGSIITVNGDFAEYNAARLTVGEDIVCAGGSVTFGGGSAAGGLDEAAFTSFIALRSGEKVESAKKQVYGFFEKKPDCYEPVTVSAGGMVRASGDITVHSGSVPASTAVLSRDGEVYYF